jgi:peptide/nickel transport system permease protein
LSRRLRTDRFAQAGLVVLVLLAVVAIFAPFIAPHNPVKGSLAQAFGGPSGSYWLGTDDLGRDVFSRLVYGTRVAWVAGLEAVGIGVLIGVPLGIVMGFRGGRVDAWIMRVVDAVIAVPGLVVAIALIAVIGPGVYQAMFAVGIVFATVMLRFARGEAKAARGELWVTAALSTGATERQVMRRHVLPYIAPVLIVQVTLLFSEAILAEAGLSFVGLGVQPPAASWGGMLTSAQNSIASHPWLAVPPGLAIVVMVLAFNAVGDGLRDALGRTTLRRAALGGARARRRDAALGTPAPARTATGPACPDGAAHGTTDGRALDVQRLTVSFPGPSAALVPVVDDVSFSVAPGEILAVVGETGSGKSMIVNSLLGIVPSPGQVAAQGIAVNGAEVTGLSQRQLRRVRGQQIGVVFQEPKAALNPAFRIGAQLRETLRVQAGLTRRAAADRAVELLDQVRIPDAARAARLYPHEFSGGMTQRAMIAMALACDPAVLVADEPTTALDVTVQAQILDLLLQLREDRGMATVLITHDLGVVADVADRAVVLYAGQVVESGQCQDLFCAPRHPYTEGMLRAVPRNRPRMGELVGIRGSVPAPGTWPAGCRFADRCAYAKVACTQAAPELLSTAGQQVRCLRAEELSLKGEIAERLA